MKKTLLGQIYPSFFLTIIIGILSLALVATTLVRSFAYDNVRVELEDAISLADNLYFPPGNGSASILTRSDFVNPFVNSHVRITILTLNGKVVMDSKIDPSQMENHFSRPEISSLLSKAGNRKTNILGTAIRKSETTGTEYYYLAKLIERDGKETAIIRASMPVPLIQDKLGTFYFKLALGGILILLVSIWLSYTGVKKLHTPLVRLGEAARRFGRGDLDFRCGKLEPEEINVLGLTMNSMASQLKERIDDVEGRRKEAEAILAGMAEGVIVLDRNLRIVKTNIAAMRLASTQALDGERVEEAFVGKGLLEAFRNTELKRIAKEALESGAPVEGSLSLYVPEPRYLQVYAVEIPGIKGGACLIMLHDVTRLIRLENIRRDFVANVSHELKTPITSIKGFVETLSDGSIDDPVQSKRFLEIISRHARRLEDIIEDLLALARLEQQEGAPLETEALPLLAVLEDVRMVCKVKSEDKNIAVMISCPADIEVKANRVLLEQALVNLLDNALKYSEPDTTVYLKVFIKEDKVAVAVEDQGVGIPVKDIPRIFERFYRVDKGRSRDAGGTGLGLAIVKHIMTVHGGSVSLESWEGEGSTFTLLFPRV